MDMITAIYHYVLGRAPDAGGYAYWKQQYAAGSTTYGEMVYDFVQSQEYQAAHPGIVATIADANKTADAILQAIAPTSGTGGGTTTTTGGASNPVTDAANAFAAMPLTTKLAIGAAAFFVLRRVL